MRGHRRAAVAGCIVALAFASLASAQTPPNETASESLGAETPNAETLGDAIALAYQTNPTLQAERAQLRATDEEYVQAEAGLRPQVTGSGSYTYSDQKIGETGTPSFSAAGGGESAVVQLT
jgi:outer membrane protein TolC